MKHRSSASFFFCFFVCAGVCGVVACGPGLGGPGGEGEGDVVAEGEGERLPIDVGPPPSGYAATPPASADGVCSTAQWWTRGDRESQLMHPGRDCIECHAERHEGPRYTVAGTVFQNVDDEDDCRGIPAVVIDILDSGGNVAFSMTSNSVGNFHSSERLSAIGRYTARVTYDGRSAEMTTPQTDGACNHCHTAVGIEDAPGRILVP